MKRVAFRRLHREDLFDLLYYMRDWQGYGSIRGRKVQPRDESVSTGRLSDVYHGHIIQATYVVWSYDTPIAWHHPGDGWVVPDERYSVTTTQHQNKIKAAIFDN